MPRRQAPSDDRPRPAAPAAPLPAEPSEGEAAPDAPPASQPTAQEARKGVLPPIVLGVAILVAAVVMLLSSFLFASGAPTEAADEAVYDEPLAQMGDTTTAEGQLEMIAGEEATDGGYVCVSQVMTNGNAAFSFEYDEMGRLASVRKEYGGLVKTVDFEWTGEASCLERQELDGDGSYSRQTSYHEEFVVDDGRVRTVRCAYDQSMDVGMGDETDSLDSFDAGTATVDYHDAGAVASIVTRYDDEDAPIVRYYDDHGYLMSSSSTDTDVFEFDYDATGNPVSVTIDSSQGWSQTFLIETDEHGNIVAMNDDEGEVVATYEWVYVPNLSAVGAYQALAYQPHLIVGANW